MHIISSSNDYLCIGPIGSRNDYTTFYKTENKDIWVRCGCFNNSIEEFEKRVKRVHKNTVYEKQYLEAVRYAKIVL